MFLGMILSLEKGLFVLETSPCFVHFNGRSYETKDGGNIMPVFVGKMISSRDEGCVKTIDDEYIQSKSFFKKQK